MDEFMFCITVANVKSVQKDVNVKSVQINNKNTIDVVLVSLLSFLLLTLNLVLVGWDNDL